MKNKTYNYFGTEHGPKFGAYILMDNWRPSDCLMEGDSFSPFRLNSNHAGQSFALSIEITGRTYRRFESCNWVRIKITFPGDGEPDSYTKGWLLLDDRSRI